MFATHDVGGENAEFIRNNFNTFLKNYKGLGLEVFQKTFTFVTDWAAVMDEVFGSSISSNKVSFSHSWVACISYRLNTVMKTVMDSHEIQASVISKTLHAVKSIVGTVNHANLNDELAEGYKFFREIPTRFGTIFDVVRRFIRSNEKLKYFL